MDFTAILRTPQSRVMGAEWSRQLRQAAQAEMNFRMRTPKSRKGGESWGARVRTKKLPYFESAGAD